MGSMFLAAILLKLGGYGVLLFQDLILSSPLTWFLVSLSAVGALYVAALCCQVLDLKVLIAFSSVGHIGIALISSCLGSRVGAIGGCIVLISHGFSSSLRFYAAYIIYKTTSRRRLVLNKRVSSLSGVLILFWVLRVLRLVGCPPSLNLWVEISIFILSLSVFNCNYKVFILVAFLRGVYAFLLIGKFCSGGDLVYKFNANTTLIDQGQLFFRVFLTIISLTFIPLAFC